MALKPPDLKRCQGEQRVYQPFTMGGVVSRFERCGNKPSVVATETEPGDDGQKGSMSVCPSCLVALKAMRTGLRFTKIRRKAPTKRGSR